MPIYSYQCLRCGHTIDLLRSYAEMRNAVLCPACEKEGITRFAQRVFAVGQLGIQIK